MGTVDIDDDDVRRFVVRHYAYDPERRERRHRVVAVVDNRREFERVFTALAEELDRRRKAGEDVDHREHVSGIVMEPGHVRRERNARLVRRAIAHRAWSDELHALDLPASTAILGPSSSDPMRG